MNIVCPHCDKINRLAATKLNTDARCGSCKQALFIGQPAELNNTNFQRHIERNDIPIVVDFWASWCGPCLMMAPFYVQAAARVEPRIRLAKLNTDEAPALSTRFQIRGIPTLIAFHRGRELDRHSGAMELRLLLQWIQSVTVKMPA